MPTAKPTEEPADEIRDELKALRDDFAKLVDTVKSLGGERAESVLHRAKEAAEHTADEIRMSAGEARQRGEAAAEDIEAMIQRHPLTSILVAVGLGFIFGRARH